MMKFSKKHLSLMILSVIATICNVSCGSDDENEPDQTNNPTQAYEQSSQLFQKLKGTSWTLVSDKHYNSDGSFSHDNVQRWPERKGLIFTFSTTPYPGLTYSGEGYTNAYSLFCSGYKTANAWEIIKGQLHVDYISGAPNILFGYYDVEFYGNSLLLSTHYDNQVSSIITLNKTYSSAEPDGNGNQTGNSSYEKPEIGLEDFTCYATSITVKYRIYNQDEAKVTSATGYYGTSSPSKSTSATVSGSLITIRATGLKKGTTYYIKCIAKGKGGSTTSEITKLTTEY